MANEPGQDTGRARVEASTKRIMRPVRNFLVNSSRNINGNRTLKTFWILNYHLADLKRGGPTRTIANIRKLASNQIDISMFARNRDLGSAESYDRLTANSWINTETGPICYRDTANSNTGGLKEDLAGSGSSVLYLNSFFGLGPSTQMYRAWRRANGAFQILLTLLAKFSRVALSIKRFLLTLAKPLILYRESPSLFQNVKQPVSYKA